MAFKLLSKKIIGDLFTIVLLCNMPCQIFDFTLDKLPHVMCQQRISVSPLKKLKASHFTECSFKQT